MRPGAFDKKRLAEDRKLVASSSPVEGDAQQRLTCDLPPNFHPAAF